MLKGWNPRINKGWGLPQKLLQVLRRPANCILWLDNGVSGTLLTDKTSNENDGTCYNTIDVPTVGKTYNGSSAYCRIAWKPVIDITSAPLTIAGWISPAADASDSYILIKNTSSTTNIQYAIFFQSIVQNFTLRLENLDRGGAANNSIPKDGGWKFFTAVWDGTHIFYYVNGAPSSGTTGSYSGSLTSRTYLNLARRETPSAYFKGDIGEIWMTNSAMSESEITALYNLTKARYGL